MKYFSTTELPTNSGIIISAFLIILLMKPYFVWQYDLSLIRYILIGIVFLNFDVKRYLKYWIFFALSMLIFPFSHQAPITFYLSYIGLSFIPFTNTRYFTGVYGWFVRIYSAIMVLSMLVWFLTLFHIITPIDVISPLNELKTHQYYHYPFLVQSTVYSSFSSVFDLVRFCSVFDEAGVVGTINLMILYINKLYLKNKLNVIIILSGLFSLSLVFYIGFLLLLVIQTFNGGYSNKYRMVIIGFAILFVVSIFSIPVLSEFIGSRVHFDFAQMKLVGDDRSNEVLDSYINNIRWSSEYWFGTNMNTLNDSGFEGKWGIQMAILQYGALYLLFYSLSFLFFAKSTFKSNYNSLITFVLMFVMVMYQRPFISYVEYIFLFAAFIRVNSIVKKI